MSNLEDWVLRYKEQNPEEWVEYVDEEGEEKKDRHEFGMMSSDIQSKGYLNKKEFIQVGVWKSSGNEYLYRENSNKEIRDRTRDALNADDLEEKIGALTVLNGVGVPVASSVLATVFPEKYAVVDYRALRSLPLLSDEQVLDITNEEDFYRYLRTFRRYGNSTDAYEYYLDKVRQLAQSNDLIPREVDMALWQYDKENSP